MLINVLFYHKGEGRAHRPSACQSGSAALCGVLAESTPLGAPLLSNADDYTESISRIGITWFVIKRGLIFMDVLKSGVHIFTVPFMHVGRGNKSQGIIEPLCFFVGTSSDENKLSALWELLKESAYD